MLIGANCDRTGRKSLMTLPFIGKIIRYILLTAVAYYNLPDWCIILSVMFDGLCGAQSLCILGAFSYVADCTTAKNRTPATIITNISIAASRILPLVTLGFYLQSHHFLIPMLIGLGLSIFGFMFTLLFQPESNVKSRELNVFQQLGQVRFEPVKNILKVYLLKREGNKQRRLLINVATHLGFIVMLCGHVAVFFLYLYGAPFCFDSLGVGIITVVQIGTAVLLTIPFTLTIAKRTDSLFIPMIGCLCYMTQFLFLGLSNRLWMLYLGVCIGAIFFVTSPVIRSRISKLVEPTEYAVVFILASIFESAGYYAISAASNEIYRLSLSFDDGFIFFVLALIGLLPLSLMTYV
jgi:PCFT/HCP family folate transporter-like MFS transporter 1/3